MTRHHRGSTFHLLALAASLLAAPLPLGAQEVRDTTSLPEIVVTATRYPVAPDSVASTVTVLRGDDLRAEGIRFVGDALRQVPGAHLVQGGPYGAAASLFVRGGESDYVKVLVDGVPVNQPGGFYDFASLTTDNVERIEILRGPGSVLYGSDAIAGVIQIVTRQGGEGLRLGAAAEGGSFGSARWEASALGGGDALGWSASLSRFTSDGTYEFNNDYRNTVASGRFRARAGDRTTLSLTGRYHDAKYHFPTDFTGVPVDHNQFTTDKTAALALDVGHRFSEIVEGQLLLGRSDIETGFENPADPPPGPGFASSDRTSTDRTSADARVQLTMPKGIRGLAGASFEAQRQNVDRRLPRSPGQLGDLRAGDRPAAAPRTAHRRRPTGREREVRELLDVPCGGPGLRVAHDEDPRLGRHRVQGAELLRELRQSILDRKPRSPA